MGATVPMHHLQSQIESNKLYCVKSAGGLRRSVQSDIKNKEHSSGVTLLRVWSSVDANH